MVGFMRLELDKMEPGRWYTLRGLPGFVPDLEAVEFTTTDGKRTRWVTSAFLLACVGPALDAGTLLTMYHHKPTGAVYLDFRQVPETCGEPPRTTGLDDIEVLFARNDHG